MKKDVIIDTSIVVAVILNEKEKKRLIEMTEDCNLLAPRSLKWEVGNALSAMFKKKRISLDKAKLAAKDFLTIPIQYLSLEFDDVLEICYRKKIYAYDAYMIVSALNFKKPLLTLDQKLQKIAKEEKIKVLEV